MSGKKIRNQIEGEDYEYGERWERASMGLGLRRGGLFRETCQ